MNECYENSTQLSLPFWFTCMFLCSHFTLSVFLQCLITIFICTLSVISITCFCVQCSKGKECVWRCDKSQEGSNTVCCKYMWLNHFKGHYVFHNPKTTGEAAASNHVTMVVLKNLLLASNQWLRERLLHWRNLTPIEQAFLQSECFVALSFSLYRKHCEGLNLQKTTSCSCWEAILQIKAPHGVSLIQSMVTEGIH